jgi:hypothetical protein
MVSEFKEGIYIAILTKGYKFKIPFPISISFFKLKSIYNFSISNCQGLTELSDSLLVYTTNRLVSNNISLIIYWFGVEYLCI